MVIFNMHRGLPKLPRAAVFPLWPFTWPSRRCPVSFSAARHGRRCVFYIRRRMRAHDATDRPRTSLPSQHVSTLAAGLGSKRNRSTLGTLSKPRPQGGDHRKRSIGGRNFVGDPGRRCEDTTPACKDDHVSKGLFGLRPIFGHGTQRHDPLDADRRGRLRIASKQSGCFVSVPQSCCRPAEMRR